MLISRTCKPTITAVELHHGDVLRLGCPGGIFWELRLIGTGARILETTLRQPGIEEAGAKTTFAFHADVEINGVWMRLNREVGTQGSFYEAPVIDGVRVWLDAVDAVFDFMNETHSPCRLQENCSHGLPKRRHARFALQTEGAGICPERLHPWCPLPEQGMKIDLCYRGEDCWLGAYDGASAHGGLDLNHPRGTPLFAPMGLDRHFLYHSTQTGCSNNRWRGLRRWPDGSEWMLSTSHMTELTVPEHVPLRAGQQYALGAGVYVGEHDHTHFAFAVWDCGELIRLDPWILFWQMYRDVDA
jgi:hypothetical protein